jgi:hypothetical protein
MLNIHKAQLLAMLMIGGSLGLISGPAAAAVRVAGQVQAGGGPVANSTVTLWAASPGEPRQLAQVKTGSDGQFQIGTDETPGSDVSLYLVAKGGQATVNGASGDNPAIALLTVLGNTPPAKVVINELTTVASVWTNAQFLAGTAIKGNALGLRIAAGNVPNLTNVETGSLGPVIQDGVNSTETPTLAIFGTLAELVAACATTVKADACSKLFAAATPPGSGAPADTLAAMELVALHPASQPDKLFAVLDEVYPIPAAPHYPIRPAPYVPYLRYAPSAWIIGLKFTGGGADAPGKSAIDSNGNIWTGDNFQVGAQAGFEPGNGVWDGHLSEFAPNGRPISPMTSGFTGGGVFGVGFGAAIARDGNVWVSNNIPGRSISVFDKNGQPLTPSEGINFDHQLGAMQGVLAAPNGDVWALDNEKNQLAYFPKGDYTKGRLICKSEESPCKLFKAPFHLTIDQQDRIWVSSIKSDTIVRFPASDPSRAEELKTGSRGNMGMALDSKGNVWVTNFLGKGLDDEDKLRLIELKVTGRLTFDAALQNVFDYELKHQIGSITMFRPDGTQAPGSPFEGGGQWGDWATAVDGNDNIWITNSIGRTFTELCGVRTETCPPGMKTGDAISPPGGFVGGNMDGLVDIAFDPAGNVWVTNNWRDFGGVACFERRPEATSTRCGGYGVTEWYGMAKPVSTPQLGPPRQP